jgi:hypothetical protein
MRWNLSESVGLALLCAAAVACGDDKPAQAVEEGPDSDAVSADAALEPADESEGADADVEGTAEEPAAGADERGAAVADDAAAQAEPKDAGVAACPPRRPRRLAPRLRK